MIYIYILRSSTTFLACIRGKSNMLPHDSQKRQPLAIENEKQSLQTLV